jgi:hypothetical protein
MRKTLMALVEVAGGSCKLPERFCAVDSVEHRKHSEWLLWSDWIPSAECIIHGCLINSLIVDPFGLVVRFPPSPAVKFWDQIRLIQVRRRVWHKLRADSD